MMQIVSVYVASNIVATHCPEVLSIWNVASKTEKWNFN